MKTVSRPPISIVTFTSSIDSRMKRGVVLDDREGDARGQVLLHLLDRVEDAVGHGHRVGAGLLLDVEGERRALVEEGRVLRLLDAVHHLGDVAHVDRHAAGPLDRDLPDLGRARPAGRHAHERLGRPAVGGAGRHVDVLALEGGDDLGERDVVRLELQAVDDHLDLAGRLADEGHRAHAAHVLEPALQHLVRERGGGLGREPGRVRRRSRGSASCRSRSAG